MVVDSSALLAILFDEPRAEWVVEQMQGATTELRMSTVNLAECLILLRSRQPHLADELIERVETSALRFVAPDVRQATLAAEARQRYPLNLGDCFAYALAVADGVPIITLDRDFRGLDIPVVLPVD